MSEKLKEFIEIPQEFIQDGQQVNILLNYSSSSRPNHCFKVLDPVYETLAEGYAIFAGKHNLKLMLLVLLEFVQISKAVAVGFAVMGLLGYFVKLIHIPM